MKEVLDRYPDVTEHAKAAMTRAAGSQNSTGAQSAVSAPMARPGVRVTRASASAAPFSQGLSTTTAAALWIW
jgi:hypothetical protein